MEFDDKIRSQFGTVISLRDMGNGTSRLFFDDVVSRDEMNPTSWDYKSFYSFSPEFENQLIEEMQISDDDFKQIGIQVVARLLALNGRVK